SVIIFLPALTIMFYPYIDKTKHKQWLPNKFKFGKFFVALRIPILIIVVLLIVPAFLAQKDTNFIYGMGDQPEHSRAGIDAIKIEDTFGKFTPMVLLVP